MPHSMMVIARGISLINLIFWTFWDVHLLVCLSFCIVIEKFTENTRFCFICNYLSKIIPALQSRCTRFRFGPLDNQQIVPRLEHVIREEKWVSYFQRVIPKLTGHMMFYVYGSTTHLQNALGGLERNWAHCNKPVHGYGPEITGSVWRHVSRGHKNIIEKWVL